ncbi:MAG: hypothetical protein R3C39_08615 [Dehalococcoidia bacterium]
MRVNGLRGGLLAMALAIGLGMGLASIPGEARAQEGPPQHIQDALVATFLAEVGTTQSGILIERYTPVTWKDGCMGVNEGEAACTQALVDGWVLWVSSDNVGYRFHANLDASIMLLAAQGVPIDSMATAGLPSSSTLRLSSGGFTGTPPGPGLLGLLVTSGVVSAQNLVDALSSSGCSTSALAVLESGAWKVYIPGAPGAVNAAFPSALTTGTPFAVRCG